MLSNHDALNKFYLNLQQNLQFKFSKNCNIKYGLDQNIFKFSSYDNLPCIIFNPIKNKSSLLAIEDAINKRLSKIILHTIITKTSNQVLSDKIDHIFTIAGINFASNIITFTLNIDYSKSIAKIDCKYPLYDYLNKSSGNIFCGISLTESEIKHIINVYKEKIIEPIKNNLENINISVNSDKAVKFYVLIKFYIEFINAIDDSLNNMFKKYEINQNIINNLNTFIDVYQISEEQQKLDKEIYENEIKIRQKYKPDWFISQGHIMEKDLTIKEEDDQSTVVKEENIKQKINEFGQLIKYNYEQYQSKIKKFDTEILIQDYKDNYQQIKNNQEWNEIFNWQNLVLAILNSQNGRLWFDTRINKYCFRSKLNGAIVEKNQEQMADLLTRALRENIKNILNQNTYTILDYAIEIVLVSKVSGIDKQILKKNEKANNVIKILLFRNAIPTIDDDQFNISKYEEFFKEENALFYTRNRFLPSEYLLKRNPFANGLQLDYKIQPNYFTKNEDTYLLEKNEQILDIDIKKLSFIEQFIFYLVNEDIHTYYYVINWLASFFNTLTKSGTALVLLGDQEVSQDILWNKIIKEIFGLQYCTNINDEEYETASILDIAKDKLFFHIGDIDNAETNFDDNTLYKLVKDLLVKESVSELDENREKITIPIYGQMIITAKNPFPYIKRASSKCTVINIIDMDTLLDKLNIPDELILEDKIQKDLDSFTNHLRSFPINEEFSKYALDTKERESTKEIIIPNIDKDDIDKKIEEFIQAIIDKNIEYFDKVKELDNGEKYTHMKNAFEKDDGYFIYQYLFDFYNTVNEKKYENITKFRNKLKGKDLMFTQESKTLKILTKDNNEKVLFQAYETLEDTGRKELYKINNYKLAKKIVIPDGATIISSQEALKKFAFENDKDIDKCIQRTKEYKVKKEEMKAKTKEEKEKKRK